jgi:large subunit ribosomal protein L22
MPEINEEKVVAKAVARFQGTSARKARLVADLIRGITVGEARNILRFTHRPSAVPIIENVLKSVVANVDHSMYPNPDDLRIGEIQVNGGPIMYRMRPRARGRGARIRKRFCHVTMRLVED